MIHMGIAVCIKWSLPPTEPDERFSGVSLADQAALESALVESERTGLPLTVVTAGPAGADRVLREGLARGAAKAVRVELDLGSPSIDVARALASVTRDAHHVWCGDYSADRGSGSVPALIAGMSSRGQALGLVAVSSEADAPDRVRAVRRLDGGRREELLISGPAVLSVEGSVARLRRASLAGTLAADRAHIDVVSGHAKHVEPTPSRPFRPRARVVAAPVGSSALDRVRRVIDTSAGTGHGETVELEPAAAARRIVDALVEWGYLA